jgi:uncharacterized protein YdeI (YjbR/CyaY-like superfamily)
VEIRRDRLRFFRNGDEFRRWLDKNHAKSDELWIGFYKKASGKIGITYAEALDEALCHGWIDGIRKTLDADSFTTRFTPRKPKSIWSNINIAHVARLTRQGRMQPAGIAAYEKRDEARTGIYAFERAILQLDPAMLKHFKRERAAWKYFEAQPPYYRRLASYWVISAKRDETRAKRLEQLIEVSARNQRLPQYIPAKKRSTKST